jgi:hypothetical protein
MYLGLRNFWRVWKVECDFVTGTTKPSRIDRQYNNLTSLSPLKGITLLSRITRRMFRLKYGGTLFLCKSTAVTFQFQHFILVGN